MIETCTYPSLIWQLQRCNVLWSRWTRFRRPYAIEFVRQSHRVVIQRVRVQLCRSNVQRNDHCHHEIWYKSLSSLRCMRSIWNSIAKSKRSKSNAISDASALNFNLNWSDAVTLTHKHRWSRSHCRLSLWTHRKQLWLVRLVWQETSTCNSCLQQKYQNRKWKFNRARCHWIDVCECVWVSASARMAIKSNEAYRKYISMENVDYWIRLFCAMYSCTWSRTIRRAQPCPVFCIRFRTYTWPGEKR